MSTQLIMALVTTLTYSLEWDHVEYSDLLDNFVVAFRMLQNVSFPGCPSAGVGSDANLLTDGPGFCEPGKSLLDERNTGWVDPADWQFAPLQTMALLTHIDGPVDTVDGAAADAYFASRPRDSQVAAWASRQSEILPERFELERVDGVPSPGDLFRVTGRRRAG